MGVEPTYQPWEGRILPMNYTRECKTYCTTPSQKNQEAVFKMQTPRQILSGRLEFLLFEPINR